jgi:hypothetical protein
MCYIFSSRLLLSSLLIFYCGYNILSTASSIATHWTHIIRNQTISERMRGSFLYQRAAHIFEDGAYARPINVFEMKEADK